MSDATITQAASERGRAQRRPRLVLALACDRPFEIGTSVDLGDVDTLEIGRAPEPSLVTIETRGARQRRMGLPDGFLSGSHARLFRVLGRWVVEDAGSKNGTRLDGARIERAELRDGSIIECGHHFFVFREVELAAGAATSQAPTSAAGLVTFSPALASMLDRLQPVSLAGVPVLVRGATGTGKELAARAVHALSGRRGPFVAVNCGALPAGLVEAELFGARKGSYTGADAEREGFVRAADGGTLFLDEVGDLPLAAQPALLRVLEAREVVAVGATRATPVDFQLVAATHRDLDRMVADEHFRADLLARLAGFSLTLPPLCERREDLGILCGELLRRHGARDATRLSVDAARALFRHPFPLNVRELERALGAALALAHEGSIERLHLPASIAYDAEPRPAVEAPSKLTAADEALRDELVAALTRHGGNVSAVAREMGKARMQIQRWMRRFCIEPNRRRS